MVQDPITTDELIEARMDETGLTREQLLLVVAKSALVRHIATGPDKDRFVLKGGTLLAHAYKSPRQSVRDADYTYIDPTLPTVDDLIAMLRVPGTNGFHLDPDEARWTTGKDIYEAKGMQFSIENITVAQRGRGRDNKLDISMSVRSGECLDGPIPLTYTDPALAGQSRFDVMGLSLEELGAEKVLGWSSKDQSRHYIDLAYIGRDDVGTLDADNAANLIRRKFAREAHGSGRYRHIRNLGELASTFSAPGRVKLIRDSWAAGPSARVCCCACERLRVEVCCASSSQCGAARSAPHASAEPWRYETRPDLVRPTTSRSASPMRSTSSTSGSASPGTGSAAVAWFAAHPLALRCVSRLWPGRGYESRRRSEPSR